MRSLTIAGCIFALLALFFFPIAFALLAIVLGVATLAKGKVEHGLAVIVLAAACGYYGITSSLHPLDGLWTPSEIVALVKQARQPASVASGENWHVVSLQTRVDNTADVDPVCSWKLEIKNDSTQPATFHGLIEFQDAHGVKVSEDRVEGAQVGAGAVGVFTGSLVVKGKTKIARAVPQIAVGS